jgi:hypothetical protein
MMRPRRNVPFRAVLFLQVQHAAFFYVFTIGGRTYSGFVVRGIDQDRCKWALGFKEHKTGRELLHKIGEVYDLPKAAIEDKTQGEQVVPPNGP